MIGKGYVAVLNKPSAEDQVTLVNAVKAASGNWWHWYSDALILQDPSGRDISFWGDLLQHAVGGRVQFVLLEAQGPWTAYSQEEHFKWFRECWGPAARR